MLALVEEACSEKVILNANNVVKEVMNIWQFGGIVE